MADELESGFFDEAIYGKAWHGAGTYVRGAQNGEQAREKAGLMWDVDCRPLFTTPRPAHIMNIDGDRLTHGYAPQNGESLLRVPGQAVVRTPGDDVLGNVGPGYQPIQPRILFDFADDLTKAEFGEARGRFHSAGSLRGGKKIWALLDLPASGFKIKGRMDDQIVPFLLLTNSFDGTGSMKVLPTTVRVVCMNTLNAALGSAYSELTVNIRHTGDVESKVADAQAMLAKAGNLFKAFKDTAEKLVDVKVTQEGFTELIEDLFPVLKDDATDLQKKTRNNKIFLLTQSVREEMKLIPQYSATSGNDGWSYWEALNGVTRFVDHQAKVQVAKGRDAGEARFESQILGGGAELKAQATKTIMRLAGVK